MRRGLLPLALAFLLAATGILGSAGAWYPSTVQLELGTATWCSNCPEAYEGIAANQAWFDTNEFTAIRYYSSLYGGLFSCPAADARIYSYYDMSALPVAIFGGLRRVPGGDEEIASGWPYRAVIEDQLIEPGYFKITINAVDFTAPTGSLDLDIEVMEDVPDISNTYLRAAITEGNIDFAGEFLQDVTREMIVDVALTVSSVGQEQNVNTSFSVDPGWVTDELAVVAFIQGDDDQKLHTAATSLPAPDYSFRYFALGERGGVSALYNVYDFEPFRIYNMGTQADTYTMSLSVEGSTDWSSNLCDESMCYGPVIIEEVQPGAHVEYFVDLFPLSTGYAKVTLTISSANLPGHDRTITYTLVSDDVSILLVDDDGAAGYESYFTEVLDVFGIPYGVWHRRSCELTGDLLANFPTVIWHTGLGAPSLVEADRSALAAYLDGGYGNLFVSGQNVAQEMHDLGGEAEQWLGDYLHATFVDDDTNDRNLEGVTTDPISHGLNLVIEGGDGADNQLLLNEIAPADVYSAGDWTYDGSRIAGVRAATSAYKVVYFAFGLEAIDNFDMRAQVLNNVLEWLATGAAVDGLISDARATLRVAPNPLRANATFHFSLPTAGTARLQIFAPDGRVVRTLAGGALASGPHTVSWDRTDHGGERVAAGIYYCRLETGDQTLVRKAVLLR